MPRGRRKTSPSTQHMKQRTLMTHTLLFQPKPTTTDTDLEVLFKAAHGMEAHIPCLIAVTSGENHSHLHKGWTHGIVLHFEDEQHMHAAFKQNAYQSMFARVTALCDAYIIFDIPHHLPFVTQGVVESALPSASVSSQEEKSTTSTLPHGRDRRRRSRQLISHVDPRLIALTVDLLGVDDTEVTPSASLVVDLNADSLDLVEYIMTLEQTFHLNIPDEDVECLTTMSEIQSYLLDKNAL